MKKILVVDDYEPARTLIVEALGRSGNYHVCEAAGGADALRLFQADSYDMVISDIIMPDMDGMELLNSLRKIDPDISVIMITAHPALELTVSAIKSGAVDFLKKPFDMDDLLFKVELYLSEADVYKEAAHKNEKLSVKLKKEELYLQSYIFDSIENTKGENEEIFQKIAELALKIVNGESCVLFLYDESAGDFYPKIIKNINNGSIKDEVAASVRSLLRDTVARKEAVMIHSDTDPAIKPSMICVPLMIRGNVLGVLSVRRKKNAGMFTKNDLHHMVVLAQRASLNLENKILYESIYSNLMDTFKALVASIQVRDFYTEEHSLRVADLAVKIAESFNCSPSEVESLRIAALLHDIGKISIPDNILLKNGGLSEEEYKIIQNHPSIGEEILSPVVLLDKERHIIRHHHERWDGGGYPNGIAGSQIPLLARILAVADSFDAMTNDRPYRKAMSSESAIAELKKNCDRQFDKNIVNTFVNMLQ